MPIETESNDERGGAPQGEETRQAVIFALATDGRGLARLADGRVVFIPGALIGERVRLGEPRKRAGVFEARVEALIEAHPRRREAPCPIYGRCGGCTLQHADDGLQDEVRVDFLLHNLRRVGGFDDAFVARAKERIRSHSLAPWRYRQRLRWHVEHTQEGEFRAGFMAAGSNQLVETDTCPLGAGTLAGSAGAAKQAVVQARVPRGVRAEVEVTVEAHGGTRARLVATRRGFEDRRRTRSPVDSFDGRKKAADDAYLQLPHPRLSPFLVHGESFVQPHREAVERYGLLLEEILTAFALRADSLLAPATVVRSWDLYCGSGAFSFAPFFLSHQARLGRAFSVEAVEGVPRAVESCRLNHQRNLERFVPGARAGFEARVDDVSAFVRGRVAARGPLPHVVFADPPRDGMGRDTMATLLSGFASEGMDVPRLFVYVACDGASLARDARVLVDGGFSLETLDVFHAFGQTAHFETIAAFTRGVGPRSP
jgi:23S rRNA (uracil1939-C5)-methyltransferase